VLKKTNYCVSQLKKLFIVTNMSLQLKKFNMASIPDGSIIVMIGKRNTGKSFLMKDMLYYKQDTPVGTVISGTEASNGFFSTIVPPLFIHNEYNESIIERVLQRQKKVLTKMNEEIATTGQSNIDPRAFLILDDCLYCNSWTRSKQMRYVFTNGRHVKLTFCLSLQYSRGMPPLMRGNTDFVFLLRESNMSNRKRLYEDFAGCFPTFDTFCSVMDACTENYECLVIHNLAKSNRLEDQVFWYKADSHNDFRIGSSVFWQFHENNYAEEKEDESFDVTSMSKKKGINLQVEKIF
jgi:hypothetical protein